MIYFVADEHRKFGGEDGKDATAQAAGEPARREYADPHKSLRFSDASFPHGGDVAGPQPKGGDLDLSNAPGWYIDEFGTV